jgi:hypothetical protein
LDNVVGIGTRKAGTLQKVDDIVLAVFIGRRGIKSDQKKKKRKTKKKNGKREFVRDVLAVQEVFIFLGANGSAEHNFVFFNLLFFWREKFVRKSEEEKTKRVLLTGKRPSELSK